MLEYFLQNFPKDCTKKNPLKISFTTYWARITGSKLSNSVLCGLYLKAPRKSPQNLLFS
jgi:hypothetical protein